MLLAMYGESVGESSSHSTRKPPEGPAATLSVVPRIAPEDPALPDTVDRILLATDLSPASAEAVDRAIGLAVERRAQLLVMSVVDPNRIRLPGGRFLVRVDQERARVEGGVQAIDARARTAGVRATFLVWEGEPAPSILDAASSESVDVIVLGSHGRGRLGRLILGSTSARVLDEAICPVLVVPAS